MQGLRGRGEGLTLHFLKTKHCAANVDVVYGFQLINHVFISRAVSHYSLDFLKTGKTACLTIFM